MQQCGEVVLEFLRCPLCGASLVFLDKGKLQCTKCGHIYSIGDDGIIDMLPDSLVSGRDRQWMRWYDENAGQYYRLFHRIIPIFTLGLETRARRKWAKLLELRKRDKVLDVATGTGKNLPLLRKTVGKNGLVVGVDISISMLRYARRIAKKYQNVVLIRANASYLPLKDSYFDGVFHVGGINTFEMQELAIREMFRVARMGAKIVIVDEGLDPKLRNTKRGQKLLKQNALYSSLPPVDEIKKYSDYLRVEWGILLNKWLAFWPYYLVEARKTLEV